jgi:hypothetical protein
MRHLAARFLTRSVRFLFNFAPRRRRHAAAPRLLLRQARPLLEALEPRFVPGNSVEALFGGAFGITAGLILGGSEESDPAVPSPPQADVLPVGTVPPESTLLVGTGVPPPDTSEDTSTPAATARDDVSAQDGHAAQVRMGLGSDETPEPSNAALVGHPSSFDR